MQDKGEGYLSRCAKSRLVRPGGEVAEWLSSSRADLDVARLLLEHGHWAQAAFHAHQAAEKALKAVQIRTDHRFDRVHEIAFLARSMKVPSELAARAAVLSAYYTGGRYPGAGSTVSAEDAEAAVAVAQEVLAWATRS